MCTTHIPGAYGGEKRVSDTPDLELPMFMSPIQGVGSGRLQEQVLLTLNR